MPLQGKVGAVFIQTEAAPISFANEETVANDDFTRYMISNTVKRYWDKNSVVMVKVNDSAVSTGFSIEYCGGVVVFETALDPLDEVTISGSYLIVSQHGGFFNWSAELEMETSDVTTFQSAGWKENLPTIKGFSVSAESYWGDEEFFSRLGEKVIIALYVDSGPSKRRYEGWGLISSDKIDTSVEDVIDENIEFQGTDSLYYRED